MTAEMWLNVVLLLVAAIVGFIGRELSLIHRELKEIRAVSTRAMFMAETMWTDSGKELPHPEAK